VQAKEFLSKYKERYPRVFSVFWRAAGGGAWPSVAAMWTTILGVAASFAFDPGGLAG